MNEQEGADHGEQKRRSFTDAAAMFAPIVPLPGDAPRAPAAAVSDELDDDLPPATGPQPIPLPSRLSAAVRPGDVPSAPIDRVPMQPSDDLPPAQDPQSISIPLHPSAPLSTPSRAAPEPEAKQVSGILARPEPMDNAAFSRSIAPPSLSDMPGQAVAAARTQPTRRRAWPWAAALLVLIAAGAAALWVQRAPEPPGAEQQTAGPIAGPSEPAEPAPAGIAPPLDVAPAPPPPADIATEPVPPPRPQAPPVAAPAQAPEPRPEPAPEPAPEAAPAPATAGPPDPPAPEPDAATAEAPPAPPLAPSAEPDAASPSPPLPIPPVPPIPPDRRVVVYHRRASSTAAAEADRLAATLRPLAAQVETRTAAAISRVPTLRYFHAEDADAAQELATALRRPDAEWRVQARLGQASLPPRTFQIWLPDR